MNRNLLFILILLPFFCNSQVVSDAKLRAGATINKKLGDFEISLSPELRFDENISHLNKFYIEIGGKYKIIKGLSAKLNYRFDRNNDYETQNYDLNHRIDIGVSYKYKIQKFQIGVRTKIQSKTEQSRQSNPTFSRNKFSVRYKLNSSISPYTAYEFYYQFNDRQIINRNRFYLGIKLKVNSNSSIKGYYLYENKFNVINPKHNHIWAINYSIDI